MEHSFNIIYAKRYGLQEAIMIKNFQFWILKNRANKTHNHDGRTWTYNSVRAFEELFPYLTSWQVRKCLDSLVEQGVLVKGNYHKNPYERSSWYAFANESMFLYPQDHLCSTSNGNDESHKSITDNKPDGKPNNNTGGDLNSSRPINPINDNPAAMGRGGAAARFLKPSIEEVQAYAKTKHVMSDMAAKQFAEEFWNFYESNGWLVGKVKMKSWTSAVAGTWKKTANKLNESSGVANTSTANVKFNIQ